ncbi:AraC family transcriptional regulator [Maribacter litopenaei]|uniref:AraC family transcriptional regulator n=1 Tax=Maribacter litopenaei TaxID=2976127 RepID=A0ABY5Y6R3_9FLAO|nr:AraC family transcriptional regulator [Maribacter litopenaei]UWX54516.1 AraC family transcriptional regulator [Maribacter litopenaei]
MELYFTHILCHSGEGQFKIGNTSYSIKKNDFVIWLIGSDVREFFLSPDFKATYLLVSYDLLSKNNPDIGWGIKGFLFTQSNPVVQLNKTFKLRCEANFNLLYQKYNDENHKFRKEILNRQAEIFVMDMWNILAQEMENRDVNQTRGSIFERFLSMVQEHCMEHREVEFYSGKLCITAKYLTEVCKKNSGKTAMDWIKNYTTRRIVLLLQNKNLSLTEISDTLHFSSTSFFSRYVKKALGMSPSAYRNKLQ